jgi:hypothetical protein
MSRSSYSQKIDALGLWFKELKRNEKKPTVQYKNKDTFKEQESDLLIRKNY